MIFLLDFIFATVLTSFQTLLKGTSRRYGFFV